MTAFSRCGPLDLLKTIVAKLEPPKPEPERLPPPLRAEHRTEPCALPAAMNSTDWMQRLINTDFFALMLAVAGALCAIGAGAMLYVSARNAAEQVAMLNNETADANERAKNADLRAEAARQKAAEAELALEKLRRTRRTILSSDPKTVDHLKERLKAFPGTVFDIGMGPNDGEVEDFIWDIEPILEDATWKQVDWVYPAGMLGILHKFGGIGATRPASGDVAAQNVLIELAEPAARYMDAAQALATN